MASITRGPSDDDGYKRFVENVHNASYGSNVSCKYIKISFIISSIVILFLNKRVR